MTSFLANFPSVLENLWKFEKISSFFLILYKAQFLQDSKNVFVLFYLPHHKDQLEIVIWLEHLFKEKLVPRNLNFDSFHKTF